MKTTGIPATLLLTLSLSICPSVLQSAPITSGTIFLDPDIITSSSPGTLASVTYAGTGTRSMFDRRVNAFTSYVAFLFNAVYTDGMTIEIQVNPEFGTSAAALVEAEKYGAVIGQLPTVLRKDVRTSWIHKGVQPFGGGNNNLLIHTGQADIYQASGILEETLVHEAAHTSLDAAHRRSAGWVAAQSADGDFISTYARDNPDREDIAESFLPYLALRHRSDRITASLAASIQQTIPARLRYFDAQSFNMFPVSAAVIEGGGATTVSTPSARRIRTGYAKGLALGSSPYGIAVLSVTQDGVTTSEAGVPASAPTNHAVVFVEYRTGLSAGAGVIDVNTGIALAYTGATAATITFTLRDTNGQVVATGNASLSGGAHVAKFLHELKDIAPNFILPATFASSIRFGSLEIASSHAIAITALRLTTNQRGQTLLSTTPIVDMAAPAPMSPPYLPQLADGGGYSTTMILLNPSQVPISGSFSVLNDDGGPLTIAGAEGVAGSTFSYSIPARGTFVFQTSGATPGGTIGWIRLTPAQGIAPIAAGVFSFSQGGILTTESGVPSATPTTRARVYVDQSQNHGTGIAIANPGAQPINVLIRAFQRNGATPAGNGPATFTLQPGGHKAQFAGELIQGLPAGFTGVMELSSDSAFVALTLRSLVNSRGDSLLTAFPIADLNRTAPTPIAFPQVADGDGYATQFIFINGSGSPGSIAIDLLADDRAPMSILPN